jgi:endonuclease G
MYVDPKLVAGSESRLTFNPRELGSQLTHTSPISHADRGVAALRIAHAVAEGGEGARIDVERIFNANDLLNVNYFQLGFTASEAVCRIAVRDATGRLVGYGTGFLISPRLLLTNHHVLHSGDEARKSEAEFHYQFAPDGAMMSSERYVLQPEVFFFTSEELDFSVVAVSERSVGNKPLATFGYLTLNPATGKVVPNECLTVIQHPGGDVKQIAVRENQMLETQDNTLWYRTDTSPGSSGSPVFNDSWQVVALHHAGVPKKDADGNWLTTTGLPWKAGMDESKIQWLANEGIRVSRIFETLKAAYPDQPLVSAALQGQSPALTTPMVEASMARANAIPADTGAAAIRDTSLRPRGDAGVAHQLAAAPRPAASGAAVAVGGNAVHLTIPLQITVELGDLRAEGGLVVNLPVDRPLIGPEAIDISPDYSDREGYDSAFLGNGSLTVPMPALSSAMMAKVALNNKASGANRHILPYHHYSVIMNGERQVAYVSAVNIDGSESFRLKRDPDRWIADPRIPQSAQTSDALYANNDFDRGHLTRRLDPAWGDTQSIAKRANDDTFHFSNCSPQHKDFNQGKALWAGLEDYILDNADTEGFKASVFNGPVFRDDDPPYRGVKIPRQFWKVVVMVKTGGALSATAYVVSQENLIQALPQEEFVFGAYRTFQVSVAQIEQLTGLSFGSLSSADPLHTGGTGGEEALGIRTARPIREVKAYESIIL